MVQTTLISPVMSDTPAPDAELDPVKDVRTMVFGCNSNGDPDIWFGIVRVRESQYDLGIHYDIAVRQACVDGYEANRAGAFDEGDVLGNALQDKFEWVTATTYDGTRWDTFECVIEVPPQNDLLPPTDSLKHVQLIEFLPASAIAPASWQDWFWDTFAQNAPFSWGDNNRTLVTASRFKEHAAARLAPVVEDGDLTQQELEEFLTRLDKLGELYVDLEN